ncbi:myo-inositol 2-dehydrogenase/D-chiro-inositol 1-dehydrogenase [Kribbella antiqua]|uniref:Inositol 2-dehydrogenase n=1 Tax=Kribbella antiqua TaxID=2512217 RepID=A0A4R2IPG0_9ACTN|nr:Gfo/Idh/MocA family oxidoreductase [Kribbella antiqua]TCO47034.1 myo-inositol 2-dehydrogenase/D-chiro-inositol 1-dehydrogenase [Kribbella antiqua]
MTDLRIGIVGVGAMGADHAERVARRTAGARLVAVSDPDTVRAEALATALPGDVRMIADPLELIADGEVDAVILASPGFAHAEQLFACLEHGKPVLCEKPLTMDAASALRVVEAEHKVGRSLIQVGFMRRFDPEYAALKELLASGELGRTLMLHNVHRNKSVAPTFRSEMIVRDSLVHEVDVARWLFDDEITRITVHAPKPTSLVADGVLDPQLAVFELANGAIADVEVFVNFQVGYEVRCEAVAERGSATIGLGSGVLTRAAGQWGGAMPADFRVRFERAYDIEVQRWVDAAVRGEIDGPSAWDGYAAAAVCEAGIESLTTGRPVDVDLADKRQILG